METANLVSVAADFLVTEIILQLFPLGEYLLPLAKPVFASVSVFVISGLILDTFGHDLSELLSTNVVIKRRAANSFLDLSGQTTIEARMCIALFVAVALSILDRATNTRRNLWWLIIWSCSMTVGIMIRLLMSWRYCGKADFISLTREWGSKLVTMLWGPTLYWAICTIIAFFFVLMYSLMDSGISKLKSMITLSSQTDMVLRSFIFAFLYSIFRELPLPHFLTMKNLHTGIILGIMVIVCNPTRRWKDGLWQDFRMKYVRNDFALKLIGYDSAMKGRKVMEAIAFAKYCSSNIILGFAQNNWSDLLGFTEVLQNWRIFPFTDVRHNYLWSGFVWIFLSFTIATL